MSIMVRAFGVVLLVGGILLAIDGFREVSRAASRAQLLAEVGQAIRRPINAVHWEQRWRNTSLGILFLGAGGSLAGLVLIAGYRWAWAILAATLVGFTLSLIGVRFAQPPHYAFEADWTQTICIGLGTACISWGAWRAISPKGSRSLPNRGSQQVPASRPPEAPL
jgi:hypothetical protein